MGWLRTPPLPFLQCPLAAAPPAPPANPPRGWRPPHMGLEGESQGTFVSGQVEWGWVDKKGNHKEKGDCQRQ